MRPTDLIRLTWAVAAIAAPAHAQAPTLVPAALQSVSPAGVRRGQTVRLTFSGVNISRATDIIFDDPAITGTPTPGSGAGQTVVAAQLGDGARIGIHRAFLRTP